MNNNINDILSKPYVSHDEFKVPEGYFDNLQQRIISNIPQEHKIIRMPARLKYAIAACLTGIFICGGIASYYAHNSSTEAETASTSIQTEAATDSYTQDCLDYAMVDDSDVFCFLADQEHLY